MSHNGLSVSGFNYHRFSINVPDQLIRKFTPKELFKNWEATPATDLNKDFTNKHLFSDEKYLGLALPSVLVPEEYNLIINPLHDEFGTIISTIEYLGEHKAPAR